MKITSQCHITPIDRTQNPKALPNLDTKINITLLSKTML